MRVSYHYKEINRDIMAWNWNARSCWWLLAKWMLQ